MGGETIMQFDPMKKYLTWTFVLILFLIVSGIAYADILPKPITYKEESQVNKAPVDKVYISDTHTKVEQKLKEWKENEDNGVLSTKVLDRFERDGQWCFIKIVIRELDDKTIIKEEIMECADTEHGRTDKERIKELEKMIELEKAKKPGYWELFAAFYYKDMSAPEYCRLYSQSSHAFKSFGRACLTNEGNWERK
jgi:hypothetical protein|tara:strand:+ start:96649 stop:97233 length:585 start_codon:yes stop_codon:yes gene_type:complete